MVSLLDHKCQCGTVYPAGKVKCPNCGRLNLDSFNAGVGGFFVFAFLIYLLIKIVISVFGK
jgi:hypothetical protein